MVKHKPHFAMFTFVRSIFDIFVDKRMSYQFSFWIHSMSAYFTFESLQTWMDSEFMFKAFICSLKSLSAKFTLVNGWAMISFLMNIQLVLSLEFFTALIAFLNFMMNFITRNSIPILLKLRKLVNPVLGGFPDELALLQQGMASFPRGGEDLG